MSLKEINTILGEKLSAEDEDEILAEYDNLESQVCGSSSYLKFRILDIMLISIDRRYLSS